MSMIVIPVVLVFLEFLLVSAQRPSEDRVCIFDSKRRLIFMAVPPLTAHTAKMCLNRGGATVLKAGGLFCERSEPKIFFDPPTFWPVGGQNIA